MNPLHHEMQNRHHEIAKGLELLFKANLTITDWDVPEVDDHEAAIAILNLFQASLDALRERVLLGEFDHY